MGDDLEANVAAGVRLLRDGDDEEKQAMAMMFLNSSYYCEAIVAGGAIPPLIALLQSGSTQVQVNAAGALIFLAENTENRVAIAAEGAIPPLVALLRRGSAEGQVNAARVLGQKNTIQVRQVRRALVGAESWR